MRYAARIELAKDELGLSRLLLIYRENKKKTESKRLTVDQHNLDVSTAVCERVDVLGLAADSVEGTALKFAAVHHDLGKAWASAEGCWQRAIYNKDPESYAKSFDNQGMNVRLLDGYRHEFGSLVQSITDPSLKQMDDATRDLALHLIAVHHGRGRPDFCADAIKSPIAKLDELLQPAEIGRRFDRLQRRYGHWDLAWLESILMSADAEASAAHDAPDGEDENTEVTP
jgi:CRISPR-associated endonuclease/helicase Cas3